MFDYQEQFVAMSSSQIHMEAIVSRLYASCTRTLASCNNQRPQMSVSSTSTKRQHLTRRPAKHHNHKTILHRQSSTPLKPIVISLVLATYLLIDQPIGLIMSFRSSGQTSVGRGSLIGMASADPVPEPAPASTKTTSARVHRGPPMNGSIFGKRSTGSGKAFKTIRGRVVAVDESAGSSQINEFDKDQATDYKLIVTQIIEDFLANNSEGNPEEATVAFCRMIVYECSQILAKPSANKRKLATAY